MTKRYFNSASSLLEIELWAFLYIFYQIFSAERMSSTSLFKFWICCSFFFIVWIIFSLLMIVYLCCKSFSSWFNLPISIFSLCSSSSQELFANCNYLYYLNIYPKEPKLISSIFFFLCPWRPNVLHFMNKLSRKILKFCYEKRYSG